MRILLLGALLALPAVGTSEPRDKQEQHQDDADVHRHQHREEEPGRRQSDKSHCHEKPRSVLLQTGLHIDVIYCGATPDIATTVEQQAPNSEGRFFSIITHEIHRYEENSAASVMIFKPNHGHVPAQVLDIFGAVALKEGSTDNADHTGWVTQKDFRLDHRGHEWLEARQIVMQKPSGSQWVFYRIIRDSRHDLAYVLYQRDDSGGANQENSFFNSFAVDPNSFPVDAPAPGAHLPPPYPYP